MKIKIKKKPRVFKVSIGNRKIQLKDTAEIILKQNEQVTFKNFSSEYDVAKKDWGYYATPSINGRLKKEGFISALVKNKKKMIYLMVIHKSKKSEFNKYCKLHDQKVVKWLHKV